MTDKDAGNKPGHDQTSEITLETGSDPAGERQKTFSRRALLEAGWSVPLIAAVHFPTDAFAVSVPAHQDTPGSATVLHQQKARRRQYVGDLVGCTGSTRHPIAGFWGVDRKQLASGRITGREIPGSVLCEGLSCRDHRGLL